MTIVANPAALSAREQRRAERAAYRAALAEREADAPSPIAPADEWDAPVPYVPTSSAQTPPVDDWRAVLASPSVALSPVALHALHAAVRAAATAPREGLPVLEVARITVAAGRLTIMATDRYRVHALSVPVEGAADAVGYVNPRDLGIVAAALAPAAARKGHDGTLPCVSVTVDADSCTITWETPDAHHVTTWDAHLDEYPPVERFLSTPVGHQGASEYHVNPRFLAHALTAAAVVDERVHVSADHSKADQPPMVHVTAGDREAAAGEFRAAIMSVRV